jgi:hypothetical protein
MRLLHQKEILSFNDVPQLFVAEDEVDTAYVCLLVERGEETDKYLCVAVSKRRLARLREGELDLKELLETPESREVFEGRPLNGDRRQLEIRLLASDAIPHEWLPDAGFFVELEPAADEKIVEEARARNRPVIHCTLMPPESIEEPKITAVHLIEGIALFQQLLKRAYNKVIREIEGAIRDEMLMPANYQLEVIDLSAGSFTVHMQTVAQADLFGYSPVEQALELLDAVTYEDQTIEKAVELIAEHGRLFVTQYRRLLNYVVEHEAPFSYEWASPGRPQSEARLITPRRARPVYKALVERKDIAREETRVVGRLTKVDAKNRTWRLQDEEGREYNGHVDPDSTLTLAGLVIQEREYELLCEERLEEEKATGRQFTTLYLMSYAMR